MIAGNLDFTDSVGTELFTMDESEQAQLHEEDAYAKSHLDAFMSLYHELSEDYQDQSDLFWHSWWHVLEEYIPLVNWSKDGNVRHVQLHDDLLPIEEHELQPRIDQIRQDVRLSMKTSVQDAQGGGQSEEHK